MSQTQLAACTCAPNHFGHFLTTLGDCCNWWLNGSLSIDLYTSIF